MYRFILFCGCMLFLSLAMRANNVRVTRDLTIADGDIMDNHVKVNFSIAWDNSWRDDFNWDAVYIFLKCRKKSDAEWKHVFLRPEFHQVSNGYEWMAAGNPANGWIPGIFVLRSRNTSGEAALDITLQWDYVKNGYSKPDFTQKNVEYTAMCIEMVYVPNGAFYAGDNSSPQTFKAAYQPIWEKYDLVKIDGKNVFESDLIKPRIGRLSNPPENAANHVNMNGTNRENAWVSGRSDAMSYWQISFPQDVEVRYFGISAVTNSPTPSKFELFGKKAGGGQWVGPLYSGTSGEWLSGPPDSYPVSKSYKVTVPDLYRDYQIRFTGAAVAINNISMTNKDLARLPDFAYLVDNFRTSIPLSNGGRGLYADDRELKWTGSLPVAYPSGFFGFYVMKYEISQDQYVRFLNKLSLTQQKARTTGDALLELPKGGFVFGESHTEPEARNGIIVTTPSENGKPAVFGCDLTPGGEGYSQLDDGLTVACNFLTPLDMLAYADWCGLRPMSELEFEKAARAAYPTPPELGEWAWNSNERESVKGSGTLVNEGTASERFEGANVNVKEGNVGGPVRCGSFASGSASRTAAGASYWGVMELSGNLAEICYNANSEGRGFSGDIAAHGNGLLAASGATDVSTSYWPQGTNSFALRGGSYALEAEFAKISDRTKAWTGYSKLDERNATVTFRLAHSVGYLAQTPVTYLTLQNGQNTMGSNRDTVCAGSRYVIKGSNLLESSTVLPSGVRKNVGKAFRGRCEYIWYFSENNGATWNVIPDARDRDLEYSRFANDGTSVHEVLVRRLMITPEYASMTQNAVLNVVNVAYLQYRTHDTIRENNSVLGCLIETVSPAQYTWRWKGQGSNTEPLRKSAAGLQSDFYTAKREDFNNVSGNSYAVECEIKMLKCFRKVELEIYVEPRNEKKIVASGEVLLNTEDRTKRCGVLMMNPVDGEVYGTVRIGNQCWMSENVRTAVPSSSYIQPNDGNPKLRMGYLYPNNATVQNTVCPSGWSIPTSADFQTLKNYLNQDGNGMAGQKLKAGNYWNVTKDNLRNQGTNSSGFSAYGAGHYNGSYIGRYGYFATKDNKVWYLDSEGVDFNDAGYWNGTGFTIRCIRNMN